EARSNGLPLRDIARHDDTVDGRDDFRITEIDEGYFEYRLVLANRRLVEGDLGARLVEHIHGVVIAVARRGPRRDQRCVTSLIDERIGKIGTVLLKLGLRGHKVGTILVDDGLVGARIDRRAKLAFRDPRVEVAVDLLDDAGDISSNGNR